MGKFKVFENSDGSLIPVRNSEDMEIAGGEDIDWDQYEELVKNPGVYSIEKTSGRIKLKKNEKSRDSRPNKPDSQPGNPPNGEGHPADPGVGGSEGQETGGEAPGGEGVV